MRAVSSPAKLAELIEPGAKVFVSGSAGEPLSVTEALAADPSLARGAEFYCSFIPGVNSRDLSTAERPMTVGFMQGAFRRSVASGYARFVPMSYTATQQHLGTGGRVDTLLVQVSPPNSDGYCSLGPQGEFLPSLLATRPRILAVINPNVPFVVGAPCIPVAEISAYCESDTPLATYDAGAGNSVSEAIAQHIASLIPDGAALQCGLGKVPNQLQAALCGHRRLRIHSGMISDGLVPLLEAGALDPCAPITSIVALGNTALYSRLTEFPNLTICGVEECHGAGVLASVPGLHAVNSALEVDLLGQVNGEMLAGRYVSGPGGLPDFAAGARAQADGCSIIALPSADPSGECSRIVASLSPGTPVSVPQYNVDVVVTEYGCAHLRGLDLPARAERLIAIAHPDHRQSLAAAFADANN